MLPKKITSSSHHECGTYVYIWNTALAMKVVDCEKQLPAVTAAALLDEDKRIEANYHKP